MSDPHSQEITRLLLAWGQGDSSALEKLMPLVYVELRKLARRYMNRQRPDHTLQTTALVNEAYLRLIDSSRVQWQDRAHFFAVAAQMMRRILVDAARARGAAKRMGGTFLVEFSEEIAVPAAKDSSLIALDDALTTLAKLDARKAQVVELRYFVGLTVDETAEVLQISPESVRRDWKIAKSWLAREVSRGDPRVS
jgi:RNA polymerase sigma factor (TIGR02999 family)